MAHLLVCPKVAGCSTSGLAVLWPAGSRALCEISRCTGVLERGPGANSKGACPTDWLALAQCWMKRAPGWALCLGGSWVMRELDRRCTPWPGWGSLRSASLTVLAHVKPGCRPLGCALTVQMNAGGTRDAVCSGTSAHYPACMVAVECTLVMAYKYKPADLNAFAGRVARAGTEWPAGSRHIVRPARLGKRALGDELCRWPIFVYFQRFASPVTTRLGLGRAQSWGRRGEMAVIRLRRIASLGLTKECHVLQTGV